MLLEAATKKPEEEANSASVNLRISARLISPSSLSLPPSASSSASASASDSLYMVSLESSAVVGAIEY